ncbi:MAG TPA: glycoside hydrolase family 16 protein [Tepidisphaeraceae bacterium]|jgi:hypothetical protein|nr:glycoside hydrolase family 16 protein [Tepidisphaeraceae bacterium]
MESLETRQLLTAAAAAKVLLQDAFTGSRTTSNLWQIPSFLQDGPATYYGRTQIRTSENAPLPKIVNGAARLTLDTYNPTGFSIYGSELISKQTFQIKPGKTLEVQAIARLNKPTSPGIVGGFFLYMFNQTTQNHDEVDFEFLSNQLQNGHNKVATNVYANQPLGTGSPQSSSLPLGGTLAGYHTYTMRISSSKVVWKVDGQIIRTEYQIVPAGPFKLHFNLWAPDTAFNTAYSAKLQPTNTPHNDKTFAMDINQVTVKQYNNS